MGTYKWSQGQGSEKKSQQFLADGANTLAEI